MATQSRPKRLLSRPDVVFGFADESDLAENLAHAVGAAYRTISVHVFPDGETKVTVPGRARRPLICRALDRPNAKLIELLLAASVLKAQGVEAITLAAPYLAYMRQDKAFHPGEAVSQKVVGQLLSRAFDGFVTVDPHLHRVRSLSQVFARKPAVALTAARVMADHFGAQRPDPDTLAIGPDIESKPLVSAFAQACGITWTTARKTRRGDHSVKIALPARTVLKARPTVIVDDIISSGTTIMTLASMLKSAGARRVDVYSTHALFDDSTARALKRAGVDRIFSCDGIQHESNAVSLAPLIAESFMSKGQKIKEAKR